MTEPKDRTRVIDDLDWVLKRAAANDVVRDNDLWEYVILGDDGRPLGVCTDAVYEAAEKRGWLRIDHDGRVYITGSGRQYLAGRHAQAAARQTHAERLAPHREDITRRAADGQSDRTIADAHGETADVIRRVRSTWGIGGAHTARQRRFYNPTVRAEMVNDVARLEAAYRDLNWAERVALYRSLVIDGDVTHWAFGRRYGVRWEKVGDLREAAQAQQTKAAA